MIWNAARDTIRYDDFKKNDGFLMLVLLWLILLLTDGMSSFFFFFFFFFLVHGLDNSLLNVASTESDCTKKVQY
jgi:hypothetical protein